MRGRALLCIVSLALCGLVMASDLQVMIYDHTGSLVTDQVVSVTSPSGRTLAKLQGVSDGVYALDPSLAGQKVVVRVLDPALGFYDTMDIRIPEYVQGPVIVTLPTPPGADPQQIANDECINAIPIDPLPALVAGSTVGALGEVEPDCETPNTAGGVWYSFTGAGNPVTLTTCELDANPGSADYDTKISVYCMECGVNATCVGGNDDTPGGDFCGFTFHSTLTVATQATVTYYVLVHGFSTGQGNFEMSVYEGGTPQFPLVECIPPPPSGACCIQECNDPVFGVCEILTADDCLAAGGEYQGDDVGCAIPNGTTLALTNPTPVPIPDGTSTFVCSTIDVVDPLDCDAIVDLDVGVIVTHTWIGDLTIEITGPNGAITNMWDNRCGSTTNMDFYFDDEGTDSLCSVVAAPGVGRGQPTLAGLGPALSQWDGTAPDGTWELCAMDTFPADAGQIEAWTLEIDCGSAACVFEGGPTGGKDHDHVHDHGEGMSNDAVIGIESFDSDGPLDPVINSRGGSDRPESNRGPRVPAGTRLPR